METALASQEKPLVLVADDSRLIRKTIIKMLGDQYDVIECVDGVAAWAQIQHNAAIDIAITDIDMPNMDGYGLLCRVRASDAERLQNIPMIVITGAEDEITKERAYACGANDFILKPINADQLRTCISRRRPRPRCQTLKARSNYCVARILKNWMLTC